MPEKRRRLPATARNRRGQHPSGRSLVTAAHDTCPENFNHPLMTVKWMQYERHQPTMDPTGKSPCNETKCAAVTMRKHPTMHARSETPERDAGKRTKSRAEDRLTTVLWRVTVDTTKVAAAVDTKREADDRAPFPLVPRSCP